MKTGERPTEALLRIWGSKGYKIVDLYAIFFQLKLIRCMKVLLPYGTFHVTFHLIITVFNFLVDKELHEYTKCCVGLSSSVSKIHVSKHLISEKNSEVSKVSKHLSVVYSKRSPLAADNINNATRFILF